jgi:hypothetical protein
MTEQFEDNGEVFRVIGNNISLARGPISPSNWAKLSIAWKLDGLNFLCKVLDKQLTKKNND